LLEDRLYLDTTVFHSRELGDSATKTKIGEFLKDKTKATSSYVQMEINRTVLKDAIYLHSMMVEEANLPAVFTRLQSYPATDRRIRRCLQMLGAITQQRQLQLANSMARLENLIIFFARSMYAWDVDIVPSGTKCPLSDPQIQHDSGTYTINMSCTRRAPVCDVSTFMKNRTSDLERILAGTKGVSGLGDLVTLIEKVITNPEEAKGRNCMTLGDLIICLDSPSDYVICSTNTEHFQPICKSLAKQFVSPG
jgi:hypothetical protein